MKRTSIIFLFVGVLVFLLLSAVPTNINDFFLPGSQPGESGNIEHPNKCDNCHGGYDEAVEPAFNWRGSMMAQAARDPLYLACLAIANQDAPEAGDLCIRCHAPDGWLNGRSEPTDGSALNNNDREGVQCDFCHKLVKPSELGINPYSENPDYTNGTYLADQTYLGSITMIPPQSGNGMYIAHAENAKRGPFFNAPAKHQIYYSPFHSESDICATCHDVSNPVYTKNTSGGYSPNVFGVSRTSFNTYMMLPVERTFSEWKMSAYNTPEGVASEVFGGNKSNVSTCQDCHMKDVTGYGANKRGIPLRNDLPLHDMTGGNTFVPGLVSQLFPDETNANALDAGIVRTNEMLKNATSLNLDVTPESSGYIASVEVVNETGHKLPSGYPEGRRIWINLRAFDIDGNLLSEFGAYDPATASLSETGTKVYEIKLGMSEDVAAAASADGIKAYEPGESFHFVLNDIVIKDNRIPPRGFTNDNFEEIQSPPVNYSYSDGQYWDITEYALPEETFQVNARLMYQTVSKEYVEFLRNENSTNNAGQLLYDLWLANGKSAPVIMNEANFYNGTPPVQTISATNTTFTRQSLKGGRIKMKALVLVLDAENNPVSGAEVAGWLSGPTSNNVSGTTTTDGLVEFTSSPTKNANIPWCLNITNIVKTGYEFTGPVEYCEVQFKSSRESITRNTNLKSLFVYPNPSNGLFSIDYYFTNESSAEFKIFNLSGKELLSYKTGIHSKGHQNFNWNVKELDTGLYILKAINNDRQESLLIKIK